MKERPVDPEEVKRVYEETRSLRKTGEALYISRYTVIKVLDESGVDRRHGRRSGCRSAGPTLRDRAVEAYGRLGTIAGTAAELHIRKDRVSELLKDAGILERKVKSTDPGKRYYDDIDKWLRLIPGGKVLTPKGPRVISEVYPYHITVRTRYGRRECFTKGSLLVCAALKAAGLEYREREEKE